MGFVSDAQRARNARQRASRRALFGQVSLLAVLATGALVVASDDARSETIVTPRAGSWAIDHTHRGQNGRDGETKFLHLFGSVVRPTAGGDGDVLKAANSIPGLTHLRSSTGVVLLGSTGGDGGDGKLIETGHNSYSQSGGAGGAGGAISFTQDANAMTQLQAVGGYWTTQTGLIVLNSIGGRGGYSMEGPGYGGQGGAVTLSLGDNGPASGERLLMLSMLKDNFSAAWITSQGGASGDGGDANKFKSERGGRGGEAVATIGSRARLSTSGDNAPVLAVQSVGGAGGSHDRGGFWHAPGSAGNGGGAKVTLKAGATLTSSGDGSAGAVIQSIGGQGRGNSAILGGAGGGRGGDGGHAQALLQGDIVTRGANGIGVLAQSVGGSGGHGGAGVLSSGSGGNAGNGGATSVEASGKVQTSGRNAIGIVAQSVGGGKATSAFQGGLATAGGGGAGGSALLPFFSSGGVGGTGGGGGTVTVTNAGMVITGGEGATGILAQSIGGGGGAGGEAKAFGLFGAVALGGEGGKGATGGAVTVRNAPVTGSAVSGAIKTSGAFASGILAQSVGGGGGSGGDATAVSIGLHLAYARAVGGRGGEGGVGGSVSVANNMEIVTEGMMSSGVVAMSIGGGGGHGGAATAKATAAAWNPKIPTVVLSQGVGGDGGGGNRGGQVTVDNAATIRSLGLSSNGVLAMSVGGGGGSGGAVLPLPTVSLAGAASLIASLAGSSADFTVNSGVGGNGGTGGMGGLVAVTNSGTIITDGQSASGIVAMSVGGGGGKGGDATLAAASHVTFNDAVGGAGGSGNHGGQVRVTHAKGATILTRGAGSHGVHALSVGGGGGIGGGASATSGGSDWWSTHEFNHVKTNLINMVKSDLPGIRDVVVKHNIFGGIGKAVFGFLADKVGISPDDARKGPGIFNRLKPAVPLELAWNTSVGGTAGAGGDGGGSEKQPVQVTSAGSVTTYGSAAFGIAAQSIGGGGGAGGLAAAGSGKLFGKKTAVGGSGAGGGNGGAVLVEQTGAIATAGRSSHGIFAQSVGGGGGMATMGRDLQADDVSFAGVATLGGTDGMSGNGGMVSVINGGAIATAGAEAHGVFAQSVGGGGGVIANAAYDVAALLDIRKELGEAATVEIFEAFGINIRDDLKQADALARSQAGGGTALLPTAGAVVLGGATGVGGAVNVQLSSGSSIATTGDHAYGVLAQSVGGGGGYAGPAAFDGSTRLVIGNVGASSGAGGAVQVTSTSPGAPMRIATTGREAHGVFAQSIGGGGGLAGTFLTNRTGHGATLIGAARQQGLERLLADNRVRAGDKALETLNKLPSDVLARHGLEAGSAQSALLSAMATDADTFQTLSEKLTRFADNRSVSTGTGGAVTIDLANVTISAAGQDAFAIYAQSGFQKADGSLDATRAGGVITMNIGGTVTGGAGRGAAIGIDGGADNSINIAAGSTISASSGRAILGSFGRETINNNGLIIGDIDLAVGASTERNVFNNMEGGTYRTGGAGVVRLGGAPGAGEFTNLGALDIGGVNNFATASIVNGAAHLGGRLLVDVTSVAGAPQASDRLHVQNAVIDGLRVTPHAVQELLPGRSFTVLTADRLTERQQAVSGSSHASPITWSVATAQNAVTITPGASFVAHAAGKNLTQTEQSYLASMQGSWDRGDRGMADTFARIANITSARDYQEEISSRTATEEHAQSAAVQTLGARQSLGSAMSCPAFEGSGMMLRENQCVWSRITGSREAQLNGHGHEGFTQTGVSYRVGAQWQVRPDWFVGVTAAYNTSWLNSSDRMTSSTGRGGDVALALKYQTGGWLFAGALHAGYGSYDNRTLFAVGDAAWSSVNNTNVWTGGVRLRAAYEMAFSNWYLRPYADLDALYTYQPGYVLAGANSFVRAHTMAEWSIAFEPGVEIGARINVGDNSWLRPYASIGGAFIHGDGLGHRASFGEGAGSGITYLSNTNVPEALLAIGGGVQFYANDVYELRGEYKAKLARDYIGQEASIRLSMRF